MYAIAQKEGLGFDKAVETCKARMARYQVVPNMLIVPPQLLLYLATAPDEKINFSFAGPTGPANFEAGVNGYEARAFRGCGVFASTPFEVHDETDSLQMLQRSTQVGEFYRMKPPEVWNRERNNGRLPGHYMVRRSPLDAQLQRCRLCALSHPLPHTTGHPHLRRGVGPPRADHLRGRAPSVDGAAGRL